MTWPKISVIIPTYNCSKYITDAIQSVLNQTYNNYEIIIIDDGSTDNTKEILAPYISKNLIKYIQQSHLGQAAARNRGLNESTGDYIAFLDADDMWKKAKLEKQIELIQKSKVDVCYTDSKPIDTETGSVISYIMASKIARQLPRGNVLKHLIFFNPIALPSVLVKRECFEKVGTFDESIQMGDDWDMLLRLSTRYKFDFVNEKLCIFRRNRPNSISSNKEKRITEQERIIKKFFQLYPHILHPKYIRKTYAYRSQLRGYEFANINFSRSLIYYWEAIKYDPFNPINYKGILRCIAIKYALHKVE